MLPSILNIAEDYSLQFDIKTHGKKETLCKCPFCHQDSKSDKHYLSLNTKDNVFKCWYCKKSGGVLQFESLLSGEPYKEVRAKYFGAKKNMHPAYSLSPDQLREIGWQNRKRQDFQSFKKKQDEVIRDWKIYEFEELMKHYALLALIAKYPNEGKRVVYYSWFTELVKKSKCENLATRVIKQYKSNNKKRWAIRGERLADIAYDISIESGDFSFQNLFLNVIMSIEVKKIVKETRRLSSVSI